MIRLSSILPFPILLQVSFRGNVPSDEFSESELSTTVQGKTKHRIKYEILHWLRDEFKTEFGLHTKSICHILNHLLDKFA